MARRAYPGIRAVFLQTLVTRGIGFVLGMANSILVARALGAEGRGEFTLLLTVLMFLSLVLGQIGNSNTILLGRDEGDLGTLLVHSLLFTMASVGLVFVGYATLSHRFDFLEAIGAQGLAIVALFFATLGLQVFSGGLNGLLVGRQDFSFTNLLSIGAALLVLGMNYLLLFVVGLGVLGALASLAANLAFTCLGSLFWLSRFGGALPPRRWFSAPLFVAGLGLGARAAASNLATALMLRFDVFLVEYYLGTRSVGVYSVAVNVAELVLLISGTLNTIAFAKAATEGSVAGGVARSATFSLAASLAFWAFLAVAGRALLPLAFGEDFRDSYIPCLLVMAGVTAQCFSAPLMGYLHGAGGYPRKLMLISWLGFGANAICNVVLIPLMGISGAALATALAYSATALLVLAMFLQEAGPDAGRSFGDVPRMLRALSLRVF